MPVSVNDSIKKLAPKNFNDSWGRFVSGAWRPYLDVAEANQYQLNRAVGDECGIGPIDAYKIYHYVNGVTDDNLVIKVDQVFTSAEKTKVANLSGNGAVSSVNGQTGTVVLNQDSVGDGSTNKGFTATEKTKLSGIASGATNVIVDSAPTDASTNAVSSNGVFDALTGKQNAISLTTTGSSGAATLISNTLNIPQYSAGGGGDASTNTSSSVDGEVALFSGTNGKLLKRATGSGFAKLTSGVLSSGTIANSDLPVLTGYASGAGTVAATDTYLQAVQKLNGNIALKAPIDSPTFTTLVVLPTNTTIGVVSATEIGYVDGVTSSIQTQLNAKQGSLNLTTTGSTGAATLIGTTLNIPQYSGGGGSTSYAQIIDVAATYGVVADGSTDNATALMSMRTALAGTGKPHYILYFPEGTVVYSNNHWLVNIVSFDIWGAGNGVVFRNIYNGVVEGLQRPFYVGDPFVSNSLTWNGGATTTNVYRFNTVSAGSRTLTLTTLADASAFLAGQRLLLFGFDQIGNGYPPGTRFHEWHEIQSVNSGTGVITLKKSLEFDWDTAWWDVPNIVDAGKNSGKPRMVILDRADYIYPKYMGFHNMTFGLPVGAVSGASGSLQVCAEHVYVEDSYAEGMFWPSMTKFMHVKNLKCVGDGAVGIVAEIDKMGGRLLMEDSYFAIDISNGTGWHSIEAYRCQFDECIGVCPRHVKLVDCTVRANLYPSTSNTPIGSAPTASPILSMEIERINFTKGAGTLVTEGIEAVSNGSYTITNVSGNNIVVPFISYTDNTTTVSFVYQMYKNSTRLRKNDNSKSGVVKNITFDHTYNPTTQTGTITTTTSSKTITGSGTNFTGQFATGNNVLSGGVYIGQVYLVNSNTSITLYDNAATAITGAAVQKAQGAFVIAGSWNVAPVAAETWVWKNVQDLIDKGGHTNPGGYNPLATQRTIFSLSQTKGAIHTGVYNMNHIAKNGSVQQPNLKGKIISIEVIVGKPYNGTGSGANLFITDTSFTNILTVNTKTAGRRYITEQAFVGSQTGDSGDISKIGAYFQQLDFCWRESGGAVVSDISENAMPELEIKFVWHEL